MLQVSQVDATAADVQAIGPKIAEPGGFTTTCQQLGVAGIIQAVQHLIEPEHDITQTTQQKN